MIFIERESDPPECEPALPPTVACDPRRLYILMLVSVGKSVRAGFSFRRQDFLHIRENPCRWDSRASKAIVL
jgi:hypothetical protein